MNKRSKNQKYCALYIVRHGETVWNVKKILQGHKDSPLTKEGGRQTKILRKKFKDINFAAVFSSDLLRAKKTAEIIAVEKKLAVQTTKLLREKHMGKYQGKHVSIYENQLKKIIKDFEKLTDEQRFKFKLEKDVESDEEIIRRLTTFIRHISVAYPKKNILVVTHGGVLRTFLIHLGYGTYKTLSFRSVKNTAHIKLLSDGVDFFIKETTGIKLL